MNDINSSPPVQGPPPQSDPYQQAPPAAASQSRWSRPISSTFDPERKSPILAAFLSCMPGLGQVYVGYYQRGFTHALIMAGIIFVLNIRGTEMLQPLLGPFLAFFWLYNVIDAGRRAALYNHAAQGLGEFEMPSDFKMPGLRGSMILGLIVMVASGIFLSNTLFDLPLDWVENWWPVAPLLFGAYLLVRGIIDRLSATEKE
jgi:hypothetical protein